MFDVLIEPCGIEIYIMALGAFGDGVLIEPCGIEIFVDCQFNFAQKVLIEPCGIEIKARFIGAVKFGVF